jgi:hypothetical protein
MSGSITVKLGEQENEAAYEVGCIAAFSFAQGFR